MNFPSLPLAYLDELTEIPNRRFLFQRMEEEIRRSQRAQKPLSFLILDVDNFKEINDSLGHKEGDRVLKEIASVLVSSVRDTDIPARYAGDEFAIILPETKSSKAQVIADRIQYKLHSQRLKKSHLPTLSIGIASFPMHASTADELFEKTDQALYVSKSKGRNCSTQFGKIDNQNSIIMMKKSTLASISSSKMVDRTEEMKTLNTAFRETLEKN